MGDNPQELNFRLSAILLPLIAFNLVLGLSFGPPNPRSQPFIHVVASFTIWVGFPMLLGIWMALGGTVRPWRLIAGTLVCLLAICVTNGPPFYYSEIILYQLLLALAASTLLLLFRLFGWEFQDMRTHKGVNLAAELVRAVLPSPDTESTTWRLQFSLASILLWTAALAVVLGALSTTFAMLPPQNSSDLIDMLPYLTVFAAVAILTMALVLGRNPGRAATGLIVLFSLSCVLLPGASIETASICVTTTVWASAQLLLLRAMGYRFLRIGNLVE